MFCVITELICLPHYPSTIPSQVSFFWPLYSPGPAWAWAFVGTQEILVDGMNE